MHKYRSFGAQLKMFQLIFQQTNNCLFLNGKVSQMQSDQEWLWEVERENDLLIVYTWLYEKKRGEKRKGNNGKGNQRGRDKDTTQEYKVEDQDKLVMFTEVAFVLYRFTYPFPFWRRK